MGAAVSAIDLWQSHIWDASMVATLGAIQTKYEAEGKHVTIMGLNNASQERHERASRRRTLSPCCDGTSVFARNPPPTLPRQGRNVIDSPNAAPRHTLSVGKAVAA